MENKMQEIKEKVQGKIERIRVVAFRTREQIDFLDKVGKDALFSRGIKLSRAQILSQLVCLLMELGIDIQKMDLKNESLEQGIMQTIKNINEQYSGEKNEEEKHI